MWQASDAVHVLKQHHISATYQRLAVLQDLMGRRDHPRAEDIWASLRQAEPPISKATVYNVLRLLMDKGIVKPLYIDQDSLRYDIEVDGHGHFHCEQCGKIYNFDARPDAGPQPGLQGFQVKQRDLYFRGICPACRDYSTNRSEPSEPNDRNEEENA